MEGMRRITVFILICALLALPYQTVWAESKEERRARLEAELQNVERQILQQQVLVEDKRAERQSLERDVKLIEAEISKAQLAIQARSLAIGQLSDQITDKEVVLEVLQQRQEKQRQSLAELVRATNEIDDFSLIELLLSNQNFSDFFTDMESFQTLKASLNDSIETLEDIKRDTYDERLALMTKQETEAELRKLQELEKMTIEEREREKENILNVTKGEEAVYQNLLRTQQKTAAEIRMQLFELRDSGAIQFGLAVDLATRAGAVTGVRPALIMGILTQETRLGENIGVPGVWTTDMHPDRDQPVFKAIAETLGFDPDSQPVSRRPGYGWGGAMGPSQFIPSTWAIYGGYEKDATGRWVYNQNKDIIRAMLGKDSPSNPYSNQDAFLATALLMRDNGAAGGSFQAERMAALRYFAGGNATNPSFAFYGDAVMAHTERIQREINILEG